VTWIFAAAALLVIFAWLAYRRQMSDIRGRPLTDEDIRAIERGDDLLGDEPLDLEEAAEEEERFWDESWDEPEPM
jgi:hypothetical protein